MLSAPQPSDELARIRALRRLDVLDSAPEREFDALVAAAALICGVPISLISLVDSERQWFKANIGLPEAAQTPRDVSFCSHAILGDDVFEVPDARLDPRFADNPLVTASPDIRFYAGAPLRLSDGARVGTLCVIDRTPRRLSEQQRELLRLLSVAAVQALESRRMARAFGASEMRFRSLSEASPLGVFATDATGSCVFTNARWQAIYGMTEAEALGDGWNRALHPADRATVYGEWQRSAAEQRDFDMEFRVCRSDGSVREVRALSRAVLDGHGRVNGYVGSVEDVTERLLERRALGDERERLAAIIEGTGAGTWEWNVQTGETRFNERWAEIIGRPLAELQPTTIQTWLDLVHPDDGQRSGELLQAHFSGAAASYECEARMRHRDGRWVWVLDRGRVLTRTADGQPEWMFGTHLDITARKAQEATLRKSEELLNRTGQLAQVGGWEFDIASGAIEWSAQTCLIHGLEPGHRPQLAEAIGYYAPEARPTIEAAVAQAMASGRPWDLELPLIRSDGQPIWVRAVGQAEFVDGKPVRLLGALQDITQRIEQRRALDAAQQRVLLAAENGRIGIWEIDLQNDTRLWDARTYELFGLRPDTPGDLVTLWNRATHPDDRLRVEQAIREAVLQGSTLAVDFRVVWPDGSIHHLQSAARVTRDAQGRSARLVGVNWDVTPLRELNQRLAEQHELLRVTLQSIGDAVITTDADSRVTWLNPVAERMTGWLTAEAMGRPLEQVFHIVDDATRAPVNHPVDAALRQGEVAGAAGSTLLLSRSGEEFGIEDSAAPIRNPQGEILGAVLVFHDVTEQRRLSGEMSYRASHDALTGLVNRAEFEIRLGRTLEKARDEPGVHALLYIDLDQFKLVNDACGHSAGDRLLQQVARLLRETLRARDTLARLGGDEFAVILEHCSVEQAQRVAQQICDRMEHFRFLHDGRRFRVGTSIGLVPIDGRWPSAEAAMQAADASCYAAKEAGRNRVHAWFDTDQALRARHGEMQWASRLERALDEDRFVLFAQRIEALSDRPRGMHAEVLVRLRDGDGSLFLPGAFLPAAERFQLARRIDRWVLEHAIRHLRAIPDPAALATLCINLSAQSVGDRSGQRDALDALAGAGDEVCRRICIEISEAAAVTHLADAAAFIEQLRALGCRVAIDDFGTGASSFGYLKTLKVDQLKIDGSFIGNLADDRLDDAAVRCFVDVARVLGVETVAECVDSPRALARLREIGIDHAQGFLLHRPEAIERLLGLEMPQASAPQR